MASKKPSFGNQRRVLPNDLIIEVFLGSDPRMVARCRFLSREWKDILESEPFLLQHSLICFVMQPSFLLHVWLSQWIGCSDSIFRICPNTGKQLYFPPLPCLKNCVDISIVGIQHGNICLSYIRENDIFELLVWNVLTRATRLIAGPPNDGFQVLHPTISFAHVPELTQSPTSTVEDEEQGRPDKRRALAHIQLGHGSVPSVPQSTHEIQPINRENIPLNVINTGFGATSSTAAQNDSCNGLTGSLLGKHSDNHNFDGLNNYSQSISLLTTLNDHSNGEQRAQQISPFHNRCQNSSIAFLYQQILKQVTLTLEIQYLTVSIAELNFGMKNALRNISMQEYLSFLYVAVMVKFNYPY
ncbi:hypothetical protein PIB30_024987 [Stylosanthes scabra]|uniref:F-box domain-containing protein n=1 Tax=Stylosanthes scabra TaxID=79078 RepID=A0ABU6YA40_9FABA|nr:hypothetical protein [Stylosanthes scabra]